MRAGYQDVIEAFNQENDMHPQDKLRQDVNAINERLDRLENKDQDPDKVRPDAPDGSESDPQQDKNTTERVNRSTNRTTR